MADSPARSLIPPPGPCHAMPLLAPRTAASRPAFCNLPAGPCPAGQIGGLRGRDVGLAQGFRQSTLLLCHGREHLGNRARWLRLHPDARTVLALLAAGPSPPPRFQLYSLSPMSRQDQISSIPIFFNLAGSTFIQDREEKLEHAP